MIPTLVKNMWNLISNQSTVWQVLPIGVYLSHSSQICPLENSILKISYLPVIDHKQWTLIST